LPTSQSEEKVKKSLYECNTTASQQNMKKLPLSKMFSFIAGVVGTGD
jgi:hypothetical protein